MTDERSTFSGHQTGDGGELGPGTILGNYELREPLGQGGMGQVWKAWDIPGRRDVALKLLPKEFRGNPEAMEQVRESFEQVHGLTHQSIGKTLALLEDSARGPYLVMDLIPGVPLSTFARQAQRESRQFDVTQVVQLLQPVAEALDFAHSRQVLHRDVKPQNILVQMQPYFQVTLIDFGLAAAIRSTLTQHTKGTIDTRGTRPYMSPEQVRGKSREWDARTDQYALAVVAYELLGGILPFESEDDFALMYAIINEPADPIDGLPKNINVALLKGLAKERKERFARCRDFINALAQLQPAAKPPAQPAVNPQPSPPQSAALTPKVATPPVEQQTQSWLMSKLQVFTAKFASPPADLRCGKQAGDLWQGNSLGMKFRWCPPGTFLMGSPPDEPDRCEDENQVRETLTHGFWVGQYPVTQGEWEKLMNTTPWKDGWGERITGAAYPAHCLGSNDPDDFCKKLTERERAGGRLPADWSFALPTEAQWEYACRAGTTTATAFGNRLSSKQANFNGTFPYNGGAKGEDVGHPIVVGSYQPNAWGLYDMHGNVAELCRDESVVQIPTEEKSGTSKVAFHWTRGGSFLEMGRNCRSAKRNLLLWIYTGHACGFRVILGTGQSVPC